MAEEPNQIKSHIDNTRQELDNNLYELQSRVHEQVHDLQHRVKEATNWRTYVNRYPLIMVGLAFAGGTGLYLGLGPTRRSKGRLRHNGHYYYEAASAPKGAERRYLWDIVKSAAIGFAASQVKAILKEAAEGLSHPHEHKDYRGAPSAKYSW